MNNTITIYELLGLIKDKKVPNKIKYNKNIFVFRNNGYEYENGNVGFFDEYKDKLLYNTKSFLNGKVEILEEVKGVLYKGLYQWLLDNKDILQSELHEGSAICGEWLCMGQLKYTIDEFDKRWYMFAKARVDDDFKLSDFNYYHENFIYPFESQVVPSFIGIVPEVAELNILPNKDHLDSIYQKYCEKVNRNVEGFVINYRNIISKYVRMKNGKLQEHFDRK